MEVLKALRQCSKGKLDYSQTLKSQDGVQKKIDLLDGCNSLPPMSPAIKDYLTSRVASSTVVEDVDHVPQRPAAPILSLSTLSLDYPSVVDEIYEDLEDCEILLNEELLKSKKAVACRREQFNHQLQSITQKIVEEIEQKRLEKHEEMIQERERERLNEMRRSLVKEEWKQKVLEEYRCEEEKIEARLVDGEKQTRQIILLKEERRKKMCKQLKVECQQLIAELASCLEGCRYPQDLSQDALKKNLETRGLAAIVTSLENSSNQHEIESAREILNRMKKLLEEIKLAVQMANFNGAEKAAKQQAAREEAAKEQAARELALQQAARELAAAKQLAMQKEIQEAKLRIKLEEEQKVKDIANQRTAPSKQTTDIDSVGMPKSVISLYSKLQDILQHTSSATKTLSESKDPNVKKYRFDLQKAVNTTVNSISANSGEGIREKISRLKQLLGGQPVDVMGKAVNTQQHPEARLFCCNLLAKKLVKQGEDQVSSNGEAAFPIAAVAIGLWSKFPEVGEHLLAHFYSVCPILIPMCVQKSKDMTDTDYMRLQGYKISSTGVPETEDMFLHRMRGIVRLYAAIISSPQLPMDHTLPHPHGLEHGWAWLSRVLNMEPHPILTAAALGDFLEVSGHAMMKQYGKQFRKLLYVLWKQFIPKMEKCTSQKGPLARLTQFLEACISSGSFLQPKGYLHPEFWRTRSTGIAFA